ncbi:nucleotidyltransferase domain-containing protein [Marinobacterium sp. OS208]|nr:nucleotidyltransferase domain-containing protein [Marinobacterium sedimentorum]
MMIPIIAQNKSLIAQACRQHRVKRLVLFGSCVDGRFSEQTSDIDLLVEFEAQLSPVEYSEGYFSLLSIFEDLFHRNVDLLTASSIKNPYLQAAIESNQELLYAA